VIITYFLLLLNLTVDVYIVLLYVLNKTGSVRFIYEGWNFNNGNYLFTTDTK